MRHFQPYKLAGCLVVFFGVIFGVIFSPGSYAQNTPPAAVLDAALEQSTRVMANELLTQLGARLKSAL